MEEGHELGMRRQNDGEEVEEEAGQGGLQVQEVAPVLVEGVAEETAQVPALAGGELGFPEGVFPDIQAQGPYQM